MSKEGQRTAQASKADPREIQRPMRKELHIRLRTAPLVQGRYLPIRCAAVLGEGSLGGKRGRQQLEENAHSLCDEQNERSEECTQLASVLREEWLRSDMCDVVNG